MQHYSLLLDNAHLLIPIGLKRNLKLITFDGDQTLYADGKSFDNDNVHDVV